MKRVYLDYAATTPVDPRVASVMFEVMEQVPGNPSSLYAEGRQARRVLEDAREKVAGLIGAAHPDEVVFCGSGTESDNAAVLGIARAAAAGGRDRHVVVSAFEHQAVLACVELLEREGFVVDRVRPTAEGIVEPEAVGDALRDRTALVSVMHANNEVGTVQDVRAIASVAHGRGAYVHTDAAQSLGKIEVDVTDLGVDALSAAGHKVYAPKGTGILYLRHGTPFEPLLRGGGQESGRRSGTENIAGAVAFAEAFSLMEDERTEESVRLANLRDAIESGLAAEASPVIVHGSSAPRMPHLSNLAFPGLDGQTLLLHLDEEGFSVSTGSACSSSHSAESHVLRSMGADPASIRGSLRVTVGRWTSDEDVQRFVQAASALVRRLRQR